MPSGLPPFEPGKIGIEPAEMKKRSESLIPKPDNTLPDPACRSPRTAPMPRLRLRFIATRLHLDLRNVKARPSDGPLRRDDQSRHRLRKGSGVRVVYRLYSYRRFNLVLWINPYVNKHGGPQSLTITSLHPFRYDGGEEDTFLTGEYFFLLTGSF